VKLIPQTARGSQHMDLQRVSVWSEVEELPEPPRKELKSGFGVISFRRMRHWDASALMGTCSRSFITGEVHLRNMADFPDYSIVDLYSRHQLSGGVSSHAADGYLFRPVPLAYRTWIYHSFFQEKKGFEDTSESGMMSRVLAERCIDAPVGAGRWSPVMSSVPMALATCLMGDLALAVSGILLVFAVYYITASTNTPSLYRYTRPISLPARACFVCILLLRVQFSDVVAIIGLVVAIAAFLNDLLMGDLKAVQNYRHMCSYEILRVLPKRVFVCRRNGAAHLEDEFGSRGVVSPDISGIGSWEQTYSLIADMHGILVELRPMSEEDWARLRVEYEQRRQGMSFAGLDVYNDKMPSAYKLDEATAIMKPSQQDPGSVLAQPLFQQDSNGIKGQKRPLATQSPQMSSDVVMENL